MNRKWIVRIENKEYVIEADYGAVVRDMEDSGEISYQRNGKLAVNGNEIKTWTELPKELPFEVGSKPAVLRKKGIWSKRLELYLGEEMIKPVE